ncbi:MAG: M23 family metallopeptidase [Firmicutes bacterium]|nr:M23 family metallopeptidase [Bacillota bacterium]
MIKKKGSAFFLLIIVVCLLAFSLSKLLPITFSGEIPAAEKIPSAGADTEDTYEEENPAYEEENPNSENPGEENAPSQIPETRTDPAEPDPAVPEKNDNHSPQHQYIIEQLSFLQSPIPGALVTSRDSQLPGAPRTYRNGTHEGLDYYDGACGVPIKNGDPVYAAGEGIILRIDHEYTELTEEERSRILQVSGEQEKTPADILDKLRGRQVWIQHSGDIKTIYAHLSGVADLHEGDRVKAGDFIGTIGNSGTSDGVQGTSANSHLHFEIWIGERYLGEGLSAKEARALLKEILE